MADDDIEIPVRERLDDDAQRASAAPEKPKRRRRWGLIVLGVLVGLPLALFALVSFVALSFAYSRGDRAGYQQKISEKGWLCKTWEGELAMATLPGSAPEIFTYTVRDDSIARRLTELQGRRVSVTYEEHRFVPTSCFGETPYFVNGVRTIDDPVVPGLSPMAPAGQAPPPPPSSPAAAPPAPGPPTPAPPRP